MIRMKRNEAVAVIVAVCLLIYAQTLFAHFVVWDDNVHLFQNPYLNPVSLSNVSHFWRHSYLNLYIPLSYTVYALLTIIAARPAAAGLDSGTATLDPHIFHAANLCLHCANAVLVFFILRSITRRNTASLLGALLFAVHPLQVESVAWVSELRGLLSSLFSLLSIQLYIRYIRLDRARASKPVVIGAYAAAILLMACGILSKPVAVMLPLVFLVIDHWCFQRPLKVAAVASLPWLLVLLPIIHLTQAVQPTPVIIQIPFWNRPLIAWDALAFYLLKLILPHNLATDYGRRPDVALASMQPFWDWIAPAISAGLIWTQRKSRSLYVAGGLIALAFLLPILGLTPFIYQRYSTVADRYCYLPMFGVALIVAAYLAKRNDRVTYGIAIGVLLVFSAVSIRQAHYWQNTIDLLDHTVSVNPKSAETYCNLGFAYALGGQTQNGISALLKSIELGPTNYLPYRDLGMIYMGMHDERDAEAYFSDALSLYPGIPEAHAALGEIYKHRGDKVRAAAEFENALAIDPTNLHTSVDLADMLIDRGRIYVASLVTDSGAHGISNAAFGRVTLGIAYYRAGRVAEAEREFETVAADQPGDVDVRLMHGISLIQMGSVSQGQSEITAARFALGNDLEFRSHLREAMLVLGIKLNRPQPAPHN